MDGSKAVHTRAEQVYPTEDLEYGFYSNYTLQFIMQYIDFGLIELRGGRSYYCLSKEFFEKE